MGACVLTKEVVPLLLTPFFPHLLDKGKKSKFFEQLEKDISRSISFLDKFSQASQQQMLLVLAPLPSLNVSLLIIQNFEAESVDGDPRRAHAEAKQAVVILLRIPRRCVALPAALQEDAAQLPPHASCG